VGKRSLPGDEKREENDSRSQKRSSIIRKRSQFNEIFRTGKRKSGSTVTIVFAENSVFQFGITFRKGTKSAVKRNKAKRRIKEMMRRRKFKLNRNLSIVFILSRDSLNLSFDELSGELQNLFEDARIVE